VAFYSGSQTNAAGSLVGLLDVQLVKNSNWEIYDIPGTNERVYACTKAGAEVFLWVQDNQANYSQVSIWEDWDEVGHVGVGLYSTTTIYWRKTTNTYWVILHDEYFIYVCFGSGLNYGQFCGNIDRYCPEYNTPLLLGVRSSTATNINPMGQLYHSVAGAAFVYLDFQQYRYLAATAEYSLGSQGPVTGNEGPLFRESGGSEKCFIEESIITNLENHAIGIMRGVMALGSSPSGLADADTITDGDSDVWHALISGPACLIRKT
jgi:hypothetical protein